MTLVGTNFLAEALINDSQLPELPVGIEFIKNPEDQQQISPDVVRVWCEKFSLSVASEIETEIQLNGSAQMIIPVSGGLFVYSEIFRKLSAANVDLGKVNVVFAYKDSNSRYQLNGDVRPSVKTFLIDDIIDSKESYRAIKQSYLQAVRPESIAHLTQLEDMDSHIDEYFVARYLSTKDFASSTIPIDCNQDIFVYPGVWVTTTFGMNKGDEVFENLTPDEAISWNEEIDALERLNANPMLKVFSKAAQIEKWNVKDLKNYASRLRNPFDFHHISTRGQIYRNFLYNLYKRLHRADPVQLPNILDEIHPQLIALLEFDQSREES